ncbi:MAG: hypothetical protein WD267_10995 [Balneolales bacterium]
MAQSEDKQERSVTIGGSDISVRLGGTIQPRVAYAYEKGSNGENSERFGFGVRRMRLTLSTEIDNTILIFTQLEGASPTGASFVDLRFGYRFSDSFLIQGGRFIGAEPRCFAITLQNEMDAIERAAIAVAWSAQTLGTDGRSYGIEAVLKMMDWELRSFLHNGYNKDNFRTFVDDDLFISSGNTNWPAAAFSLVHRPPSLSGVEAGIYGGYNPSKNPNTELDGRGRRYFDYSSYLYWGAIPGSQSFRVKADFIGIRYENIDPIVPGDSDRKQDFFGWAVFGAWRPFVPFESFVRIERYGNYTEVDNIFREFVTAGLTYSRSALLNQPFKNQRITLAYSNRLSEYTNEDIRHSIILQLQLVF